MRATIDEDKTDRLMKMLVAKLLASASFVKTKRRPPFEMVPKPSRYS